MATLLKAQHELPKPTNPMITALFSDLYQFTMAYAYWKVNKHADRAVFDLLFRRNPFGGEYTIFAGLEECIRFTANFCFEASDINYLRTVMPSTCEDAFFQYLQCTDCSDVEIYAIPEGSVVFPRIPLIRVEGPLLVAQLLETAFLNLVNYASLVTTNAARHREVAGSDKLLLEFGLRRAQGPDGGISASKYCYMGGFDGTSNVDAGRRFGIPVRGTHSHAFVSSFTGIDEIKEKSLLYSNGDAKCNDFVGLTQQWLTKLQGVSLLRGMFSETNQSELAAFTSYALSFPTKFQALVDTFDVIKSGVPNFCAVALALNELGYKSLGIRLDSGDLAYLSKQARKIFSIIEKEFGVPGFRNLVITASNDINEETLEALNKQGHEIDAFGIGTHLVTCSTQPALGCVYKLVEINKQPRMKLSQTIEKVTIPYKKEAYRLFGVDNFALVDILKQEDEPSPQVEERILYRLFGVDNFALVDILKQEDEPSPQVEERILCRHPFSESRRAYVIPKKVEKLYKCYWAGKSGSKQEHLPSLEERRLRCKEQLEAMRPDHLRALNPTPYKVSVTGKLYDFIHSLWLREAPVGELR